MLCRFTGSTAIIPSYFRTLSATFTSAVHPCDLESWGVVLSPCSHGCAASGRWFQPGVTLCCNRKICFSENSHAPCSHRCLSVSLQSNTDIEKLQDKHSTVPLLSSNSSENWSFLLLCKRTLARNFDNTLPHI